MYEEVQVLTHSSIRIAGNQINILIHFMWRKKPMMLILFA